MFGTAFRKRGADSRVCYLATSWTPDLTSLVTVDLTTSCDRRTTGTHCTYLPTLGASEQARDPTSIPAIIGNSPPYVGLPRDREVQSPLGLGRANTLRDFKDSNSTTISCELAKPIAPA